MFPKGTYDSLAEWFKAPDLDFNSFKKKNVS